MPGMEALVVLGVFDWSVAGKLTLSPSSGQFDNIDSALQKARLIADRHAGVIIWMRDPDRYLKEYGPPRVLFQSGNVPDLEWLESESPPFIARTME